MQQFRNQETPAEGTPARGGDIADWINCIDKPDFRAAFDKAFIASVARRVGFGIHADRVRLRGAEHLQGEIRDRDTKIEQLSGEVRNRNAEVERLQGKVQIRDDEIERLVEDHRAVLGSRSWRLTAPARSLKTWINSDRLLQR